MKTKVKFLHKNATFKKAYDDDSGFDLTACGYEYKKDGLWYIKLGVAVEPPKGYYFEVVPRSSFGKTPFIFANNIGIIDQGYRGEWLLSVRHLDFIYYDDLYYEACRFQCVTADAIESYLVNKRIAQAVLREYHNCEVEVVDELSTTERGLNGFGSSGK
jgi:dUTP pyrophosphatase